MKSLPIEALPKYGFTMKTVVAWDGEAMGFGTLKELQGSSFARLRPAGTVAQPLRVIAEIEPDFRSDFAGLLVDLDSTGWSKCDETTNRLLSEFFSAHQCTDIDETGIRFQEFWRQHSAEPLVSDASAVAKLQSRVLANQQKLVQKLKSASLAVSGMRWMFFGSLLLAVVTFGLSLLFVSLPLFVTWQFAAHQKAKHQESVQRLVERSRKRRAILLDIRTAELAPTFRAFEKAISEEFDCRPCPKCAELTMTVTGMSPNARSMDVACRHCGGSFKWKAARSDPHESFASYQAISSLMTELDYQHTLTVAPPGVRSEGGREPIPSSVRHVVWRRDGGRCVVCGAEVNLHFDHVIPVSKGGATNVENLQILCASCNLSKGAKI